MTPLRMLGGAAAEEAHRTFVRQTLATKRVWTLVVAGVPLTADAGQGPRKVCLFFSQEARARHVLSRGWEGVTGATVRELSLDELQTQWLPALQQRGQLVGPNWTEDLVGLELEPESLYGT